MSERSYTPGPWKISSWTGNITTADGVHVAGLDIESTRFPDAKLMAAAPEMFELLERILDPAEYVNCNEVEDRINEIIKRVKGNQ
jgi:hypothetical protein